METKSTIKEQLRNLSRFEQLIMKVMSPIFAIIAGTEKLIAKATGATYNEINIIVYYMIIPLSWVAMIDYISALPLLTPVFIIGWIIFLWKDQMKVRDRCDWLFDRSVDFLLWFKKIGWNYIVSSVIICVFVPILIYVELIYAMLK